MTTWPATLQRLRGTVGVWTTTLDSVSPRDNAAITHELEEEGYEALWVAEAWGREALTNAAITLAATSNLVVATGIASIWARDAVATANGARTLSATYDDRFVLGLGVSHQPLVERLRKHAYDAPLATMAAYLAAMDEAPMFAAEQATRVPRVLAALGPKMLTLAANAADGAHTYLVTPEHTAGARAALGEAFLCVEQAVVLGHDRDEFLRRAHEHLAIYTGLENYRASWRRMGFDDSDFVRGGSERLCDAFVVHGDDDAIHARVEEHRRAGADHVVVQVLSVDGVTPPREEWRRLATCLNEL